jgi:uncharacterized membrane protein
MTAFRVRLDTTTNWAITSSALIGTFALGNPQVAQPAVLLLMLVNFFFLHLEARRYRHFELSRARVRLLERGFYGDLLGGAGEPTWSEQLYQALREPRPTLSHRASLGIRLRRNYLWIYLAVLLTWLGLLDLAGGYPSNPTELVARAAMGSIPGWLVFGLVAIFYAWLIALAVAASREVPADDEW